MDGAPERLWRLEIKTKAGWLRLGKKQKLFRGWLGGEPFVEGDGEGEEMLFAVEGVDLFDVEGGVFEGWVVEVADVVEEIAGERRVRVDDGALEAEVVVILGDFFVHGGVVDSDGRHGDVGAAHALHGEEAAVDVVERGGGDDLVRGGDELDADVVEREGGVSVIGEDDADGNEAVLDVGQAEEVAIFGIVAGLGGDSDFFVGVHIECGVLGGGFGGRGFLVAGAEGRGGEREGQCQERDFGDAVGLHGQVDYHLG